MAAGN